MPPLQPVVCVPAALCRGPSPAAPARIHRVRCACCREGGACWRAAAAAARREGLGQERRGAPAFLPGSSVRSGCPSIILRLPSHVPCSRTHGAGLGCTHSACSRSAGLGCSRSAGLGRSQPSAHRAPLTLSAPFCLCMAVHRRGGMHAPSCTRHTSLANCLRHRHSAGMLLAPGTRP